MGRSRPGRKLAERGRRWVKKGERAAKRRDTGYMKRRLLPPRLIQTRPTAAHHGETAIKEADSASTSGNRGSETNRDVLKVRAREGGVNGST